MNRLRLHGIPVAAFIPPGASALTAHASWVGGPTEGFLAGWDIPSFSEASRTTASPMPMVKWWTADHQRFTDGQTTMQVGVFSSAVGGVDGVTFFMNGGKTTITAPTMNTDLDPNGNPKNLPGFFVTIDRATHVARLAPNTWGELKIYAYALPTNLAMQPRLLPPISLFVSNLDSDFDKTIGGGGDYATLKLAMAAQKTLSKAHAKFTYLDNATVEMENADAGVENMTALSWTRVLAASGKVVTHRRTTRVVEDDYLSYWIYQHKLTQFEGAGIVLDFKNIAGLFSAAYGPGHDYGVRFYGCTIDNSEGTLNSTTWNHDLRPDKLTNVNQQHYVEFCTIKHIPFPLLGAVHAFGNKILDASKGVATGCDFVCFNYVNGVAWPDLHKSQPVLSLTYVGVETDVKMDFSQAANLKLTALNIYKNGSLVKSYPWTGWSDGLWFNIPAITTDINGALQALLPGIAATNLAAASGLNSVYMWCPPYLGETPTGNDWPYNSAGVVSGDAVAGLRDLKNKVVGFATSADYHVDFWQANGPHRNVIIHGNLVHHGGFMNPLKGDASNSTYPDGQLEDFHYCQNMIYTNGNPPSGSTQPAAFGADHGKYNQNAIWAVNASHGGIILYPPVRGTTFHEIRGNVGSMWMSLADLATCSPTNDNYWVYQDGLYNSGASSGNVGVPASGAYPDLFTDAANGNFVAKPAGPLFAKLLSRLSDTDAYGGAYEASDIPGGLRKLATYRAEPF